MEGVAVVPDRVATVHRPAACKADLAGAWASTGESIERA
jgi:hypothetical protein